MFKNILFALAITVLALGLFLSFTSAQPAQATRLSAPKALIAYGWENGATILGSYGNLVNPMNVTSGAGGTVLPHSGNAMLQVTEAPHSGTPQAFIAYIENLTDGDIITASFYGWDNTPGASPSMRIWGHWAQSGDVNSYEGAAGGNDTYTAGTGWDQVSWSWTLDTSAYPDADALVVEVRLYSTPATSNTASTDYWVDTLVVEAPDTAVINVPSPSPQQAGDVVINEIMYHPSNADDEWFEVKNVSGQTLDLSGCIITDGDGGINHLISSFTPVAAGDYFVLAATSAISDVVVDYNYGGGAQLTDTGSGDTIALTCNSTFIDAVNYEVGQNGWPASQGVAIAFGVPNTSSGDYHLDNDIGTNWGDSTSTIGSDNTDLGTPGAQNDDVLGPNAITLFGLSAASPFAALAMALVATTGLVVLRKRK